MPQMAPLNWLTLMFMFILIFSIFNIVNYYSFMYNIIPKKIKSLKKTQINWKW